MKRTKLWVALLFVTSSTIACVVDLPPRKMDAAGPDARGDVSMRDVSIADRGVADRGVADTISLRKDHAPIGDKTCGELWTCAQGCVSDGACIWACVAQGTAQAQKDFNGLFVCTQDAVKGSCKTSCGNPKDSQCLTCLMGACATEVVACGGDMPEPGFGDRCSASSPCKNPKLKCAPASLDDSPAKSFCTMSCTNPGGPCPNAPLGTSAACIFQVDANKYECGFLCKFNGQTWPCPATLTCATKPTPQGSQEFLCFP